MERDCLAIKTGLLDYALAWEMQRKLWQARGAGRLADVLLLVEHPPTYTIGRAGGDHHLLASEQELKARGAQLFHIDRGGDVTYHGPGQLVGYPIMNLDHLYKDVHRYLRDLEEAIILTLKSYGLKGHRINGLTGVWVENRKLASIGIKVSRWVTMHGFALNVATDMSYFSQIIPCGIWGREMASIENLLNTPPSLWQVAEHFIIYFGQVFGRRMKEISLAELREKLDLREPLSA